MGIGDDLPLGRKVEYPATPDASVLRGMARAPARERNGLCEPLPFGEDVWNAYEFSWLAPSGLPRIGVLTARVPCASPRIVESKSLKLYLGGFAQTAFAGKADVTAAIAQDLTVATGAAVSVQITNPAELVPLGEFRGFCLDDLNTDIEHYEVALQLLASAEPSASGTDAVYTHLFRCLCPVTGQPDHGSVRVAWRGRRLNRAGLLAYLVSFRTSTGFHEETVERIFADVRRAAAATDLAVEGRFLRRGGIDINPWRATSARPPRAFRLPRQ